MANKTIYFRDDDLWSKAKALAGKDGLSSVIQKAIEQFVQQAEREKEGIRRFSLAVVVLPEHDDTFVTTERIAFEGRTLWGTGGADLSGGGACDIACYRTRGGKLLFAMDESHYPHADGITYYRVYDSLADLRNDPELNRLEAIDRGRFLMKVSEALGEDWAVWID